MANILIVDDSEDLLMLFTFMLRSKEFTVFTAGNIADAESQLVTVTPDIAFIDVNLARDDGRQLCSHLTMNYKIPVVLISGDSKKLEDFARFGAIAVLEKPFSPQQLRAVITGLVGETMN